MTVYDAMRADWISAHKLDQDRFDYLIQLHPDERMERCPSELFDLPNEITYRVGNGYCLSDGAWYDPCTEEFYYFETTYEPTGEVRFDLGTDYSY
jgi:hypothetical protein